MSFDKALDFEIFNLSLGHKYLKIVSWFHHNAVTYRLCDFFVSIFVPRMEYKQIKKMK